MRTVARIVAVLLAALSAPLLWSGMAGADAPQEQGWWSKLNPDDSPLEVPAPHVPAKGLYVALEPSGPAAISALRLPKADGTLVLEIADGSAGDPLLSVCAAASDWKPVQGGKWKNAPKGDCALSEVLGTVSDDGKTVTFELTATLADTDADALDVVIVPQKGAETPFQTPFKEPGDDAYEVSASSSGTTDTSVSDSGSLAADPSTDTASDATGGDTGGSDFSDSGGSSGDFSSDDPGVSAAGGDDPAADAGAADDTAADTGSAEEEVAQPPAENTSSDDSRDRLTAGVLLAVLAAGLWWLVTVQSRPKLATAAGGGTPGPKTLAQARTGGIGRFVRDRASLPNRLA